jgi:hypothetical protein
MPPKGKTTRPQSQIDEAVKRFMNGEQAVVLAKHSPVTAPSSRLLMRSSEGCILVQYCTRSVRVSDYSSFIKI